MLNLNPLNLPDAHMQQWIMMIVAGMLGSIIGYVSRKKNIGLLKVELDIIEYEISECQLRKAVVVESDDAETIVLNRIRGRASEVNFGRIGVASAAIADDLKAIVGVGPFLEKKLHAIGIYTFRQIANFTKEDIDTINDIIEFFPGRIERDNWVGQATDLGKKK